ncbi:MAG: hypothetical protein ACI9YL_001677 [Luteibaculaceae bacterium]|jgi:hypothetical protein
MQKKSLILLVFVFQCLNSFCQTLDYSFFLAGHTYGKPSVLSVGLHPPFLDIFPYLMSRPEIEFGALLGDIAAFHPNAESWDNAEEELDTLGIPVHFVPGNHDMYDEAEYYSRYEPFYSFKHKSDLIIVLHPYFTGWNIAGEQWDFLEQTLQTQASSSRNIFIFFHQLLWYSESNAYKEYEPNSLDGRDASINFWSEFIPLLLSYPNEFVLAAGDIGATNKPKQFMYDKWNNIQFIATGMGNSVDDNIVIANVYTSGVMDFEIICLEDPALFCLGNLEDYAITYIPFTSQPELSITTYPNPAKDNIWIENPHSEDLHVRVFSLTGIIYETRTIPKWSKTKVATKDFPRGMLQIQVVSEQGQHFEQKVVLN